MMFGQMAFAQGAEDAKKPSLYERIGGSDGIGKIFDEVGGRMAADPLLARFFQGQSQEALMAQRQRAIEFLCHETGGPCAYSGRPLKQVHGSLGITEDQWKAFVKHLTATLDNQKVGEKEKREFRAVVKRFKSDVVSK
jgi:hemoglobin